MKAIALANRLARNLDEKSFLTLTADARLEILDSINGGLQKMHALAPWESKTTGGSLFLDAPTLIMLGVTNGSTDVTSCLFTGDQLYRTIVIDGDNIDNQIDSPTSLLHPYGGVTGTVNAIIYCDAVSMPEPYDEIVGDPRMIENGYTLIHAKHRDWRMLKKPIFRPRFYHVEANARNQNPPCPAVIRFDTLPDKIYRLECQFTLAPARIAFVDLLESDSTEIPLREEYIEVYLLPIARGLLTSSSLWRDKETKAKACDDSDKAESKYSALVPRTLATPRNLCRTKPGY